MLRELYLLTMLAGCDSIFRVDEVGDAPIPDAADAASPDAALPMGLVAWFQMEDLTSATAIDSAGTHDGTCTTCPTVVPGKINNAFAFDGTSAVVHAPSGGDLDGASDLTIAMWIRIDAIPNTNEYACPVNKLYGIATKDTWQFCAFGGTSTWLLFLNNAQIPGPALDPGVWQHLAFTWNSSLGQLHEYLNGASLGEFSATTLFDSGDLLIGADRDNGADIWFFNGAIDDVQIYKRLLGDTEIAALAH